MSKIKILIILLTIYVNGVSASLYENYDNIEKMNTIERDLLTHKPVSYEFIFTSPVYNVDITGETNELDVPLRIEILKNVSESVKQPAGGVVYKYFNAWIRSDRVENVSITYIVNNSWIDNNNIYEEDIRLLEWNGSWKVLDTKILDRKNDSIYFESIASTIDHPSYFAIIGNNAINSDEIITLDGNISEREIAEDEEGVVQNEDIDEDEEEIIIDVSEYDEDLETEKSPGFETIIFIFVVILIYYGRKN